MIFYAIAKDESRALRSDFRFSSKEETKKKCAEINEKTDGGYFVFELTVKKV
ncbi:hypothetical protein HWB79_gp121 [Streptomyces phage LukeCage]|jgi:hypothetical protein|uniref:Uncharacterized protein n=1 Tax=Streptomyces phage LukeCage TaxID=2283304 RepID=A0A345MGK9_9CAUD|nr:hypothetical protein HWB79_gp121 [Streptomyces phage LukeCage]AXH69690.1 hypothetical protein SEA_LUKECAGE_203 [Streptomyces phage LukeCage]